MSNLLSLVLVIHVFYPLVCRSLQGVITCRNGQACRLILSCIVLPCALFAAPCPNSYIKINPIKLTMDSYSFTWFNSFALSLAKDVVCQFFNIKFSLSLHNIVFTMVMVIYIIVITDQ